MTKKEMEGYHKGQQPTGVQQSPAAGPADGLPGSLPGTRGNYDRDGAPVLRGSSPRLYRPQTNALRLKRDVIAVRV